MPTQCGHYWAGLRCQLWAGHASAHAAREDDALISWRSEEHGDRVVLDWAEEPPADQQPMQSGQEPDQPSDQEPDQPSDQQPEQPDR